MPVTHMVTTGRMLKRDVLHWVKIVIWQGVVLGSGCFAFEHLHQMVPTRALASELALSRAQGNRATCLQHAPSRFSLASTPVAANRPTSAVMKPTVPMHVACLSVAPL